MYEYKAIIEKVIDGDTFDITIDLGFDILVHQRVRLYGVDAPELKSQDPTEKANARMAKSYLKTLFSSLNNKVIVKTLKSTDKFGRYLAEVFYRDPKGNLVYLSNDLIFKGFAKKYLGGKK